MSSSSPSSSRSNSIYYQDASAMPPIAESDVDGARPIMYHNNHSVPTVPSDGPPQYDAVPQLPTFDPSVALEGFSTMSISDQRAPAHSAPPNDPISRSKSSLSMRSYQSAPQPRTYQPPRHVNSLPPAPNYNLPPRQYYPVDQVDNASIYTTTMDSPVSPNNGGFDRFDYQATGGYGYDDQGSYDSMHTQRYPQQTYNPLYAAASNVLGMGPPPGPHNPSPSAPVPAPAQSYPSSFSSYSNDSLPTSISAPHLPPPNGYDIRPPMNGYDPRPPNGLPPNGLPPNVVPLNGLPPNGLRPISPHPAPSLSLSLDDNTSDFEPRPSLQRGEMSASVSLNSKKSKAIDLSAPPYTKEYIEQYRQRIKGDPDPEAHFLYAKYLIDAARKIRASGKDQRAAKKYSEVLVTEALKVMRRLATQGEPYSEAQFYMANCHGTGALGLPVDHERAYHLYLQAAKQNHASACYRVAVCNEIGAGTRKEPERAANFYRKAASMGDTAAMYKLGMILLHGSLGQQRNPREAVGWLRRAAEQADEENPHALHELGLLYEMKSGQVVPHDPIYAKGLFTQAAHLGYTQSQYKLGQCYEYGSLTCPVDPRRSIAWYTKAAEKGDAEAELALSGWYLTGSEGVLKQSDSEAYLWARRAANKGLSKAEYAVGYYAEVGIGIKQDIEFAKRWYMRAAAQGNKRAMNRLTEMKRMGSKRLNVARPTRQQAKDECVIC
ncbi:HCP-like protein [Armillaria gallica]|uniref:HCP-like protein n=1 Tax=Armillaria gallica TaxID=47427 RepID=A0A2H3E7I9_ARMGA|nr:HCP-like protein [Armillaria gallica]